MNLMEPQEPARPSPSAVPAEEFGADEATDADLAYVPGARKPINRNAAVLVGLLVTGAFVVWFMYFRGAPQSADASLVAADGNGQIKAFLDSGNISLMKRTLKDTEKVVQQFRSYPAQTQIPLSALRTNPFRELPPAPVTADRPTRQTADEAAQEHARIQGAVAELHLQSIVHGGKYRACMINNAMCQEGQTVGMFTVEQIRGDAVVIRKDKYRFELRMQN